MIDHKKLGAAIRSTVALQRAINSGSVVPNHSGEAFDSMVLSLYATYLYCIRTSLRHKIHAVVYNKHLAPGHTHIDKEFNPWSYRYEMTSLEGQDKFINACKAYLLRQISNKVRNTTLYNLPSIIPGLELDFDMPDPVVIPEL